MPDWSRTNDRMLMIDRLDWTNGWPSVNAGAGPSLSSDAAPEMVSPASRQG
jgi:hypothetical protein